MSDRLLQALDLQAEPRNYYELLGLSIYEADPAKIEQALLSTAAKLRAVKETIARQGQQSAEWTAWRSLAKQVKSAQACLLDLPQKHRYDSRLAAQISAYFDDLVTPTAPPPSRPAQSKRDASAEMDASRDAVEPADAADPMAPIHPGAPPLNTRQNHHSTVPQSPPATLPSTRSSPVIATSDLNSVAARVRSARRPGSRWAYAMIACMLIGMFASFVVVLRLSAPAQQQQQQLAANSPPDAPVEPPARDPPDGAASVSNRSSSPPQDLPPVPHHPAALNEAVPPVIQTSLQPSVTADGSTAGHLNSDAPDFNRTADRSNDRAARPLMEEPGLPEPAMQPENRALADRVQPRSDPSDPSDPLVEMPDGLRTLTADEQAALTGLFRETRQALKLRPPTRARQLSAEALKLAAGTAHADAARRLDTVADYVEQFWQAYEESLKSLKGTDLIVGHGRVHVVDLNKRTITVRDLGQQKELLVETMPARYVLAIGRRGFNVNNPAAGVFYGAFMWASGEYTVAEVRRIWQLAELAGADVDDLPQILDDALEYGATEKLP